MRTKTPSPNAARDAGQIERAEELESMDMAQMTDAEVSEWNQICHLIGQRQMNPNSPKLIRDARATNASAATTAQADFDSLPVGAIFYSPGNRLVSFRKTAKGVTFGCFRRGAYCYRRSALYGPHSFTGCNVEL